MNLRKYHIYSANLDSRYGTEPGKQRPVVIVQTDLLNGQHPSTIICPITTHVVGEASILTVHFTEKETGLKSPSDILVDQIRAIDNRRFIKEVGKLTPHHQARLVQCLTTVLFD
jgi:mRNA interferase MazF